MPAAQHSHCNICTRRGIKFGTVEMEFVDAETIANSRRNNTTTAADVARINVAACLKRIPHTERVGSFN